MIIRKVGGDFFHKDISRLLLCKKWYKVAVEVMLGRSPDSPLRLTPQRFNRLFAALRQDRSLIKRVFGRLTALVIDLSEDRGPGGGMDIIPGETLLRLGGILLVRCPFLSHLRFHNPVSPNRYICPPNSVEQGNSHARTIFMVLKSFCASRYFQQTARGPGAAPGLGRELSLYINMTNGLELPLCVLGVHSLTLRMGGNIRWGIRLDQWVRSGNNIKVPLRKLILHFDVLPVTYCNVYPGTLNLREVVEIFKSLVGSDNGPGMIRLFGPLRSGDLMLGPGNHLPGVPHTQYGPERTILVGWDAVAESHMIVRPGDERSSNGLSPEEAVRWLDSNMSVPAGCELRPLALPADREQHLSVMTKVLVDLVRPDIFFGGPSIGTETNLRLIVDKLRAGHQRQMEDQVLIQNQMNVLEL